MANMTNYEKMKEIKIITHNIYETADGREFDSMFDANEWQKKLSLVENMLILNDEYEPAIIYDDFTYVFVETDEQVEAFNAVQEYHNYYGRLSGTGYYYYNYKTNRFINIELRIKELENIIKKIKDSK